MFSLVRLETVHTKTFTRTEKMQHILYAFQLNIVKNLFGLRLCHAQQSSMFFCCSISTAKSNPHGKRCKIKKALQTKAKEKSSPTVFCVLVFSVGESKIGVRPAGEARAAA